MSSPLISLELSIAHKHKNTSFIQKCIQRIFLFSFLSLFLNFLRKFFLFRQRLLSVCPLFSLTAVGSEARWLQSPVYRILSETVAFLFTGHQFIISRFCSTFYQWANTQKQLFWLVVVKNVFYSHKNPEILLKCS